MSADDLTHLDVEDTPEDRQRASTEQEGGGSNPSAPTNTRGTMSDEIDYGTGLLPRFPGCDPIGCDPIVRGQS